METKLIVIIILTLIFAIGIILLLAKGTLSTDVLFGLFSPVFSSVKNILPAVI